MKVSLSWLQKYVPVTVSASRLADALTMAGLEVDSVEDRYGWLDTVRVGRVVAVNPHPNADRLRICDVTTGEETCHVVCGAPNVRPDMLAPLALAGTEFPDGTVLEKGSIRGQVSEGMLCSEAELTLGTDAGGLLELDPSLPVGEPLNRAMNLADVVLEIDLTPNRPDCLSILGTAREVAAFEKEIVTGPDLSLPPESGSIEALTSVTIEDPDHCPRYAARMIEGITVQPSPDWLQDRLLSVGLRPINNIVDVTNFVMMEMGQPLHAFDFDHLAGGRIVVRTANTGEKFTTLDGKERTLEGDMLMICDGEKPVAVAGVMGGLNSEIEETTSRVLIESACFDPTSVRRTAKRLGLGTDASHRFERGVDPDGTLTALNRAAQLMVAVGGGTLVGGVIDERPVVIENKPVELSADATNRLLGTSLSRDEIAEILGSVEFGVKTIDEDRLTVTPPSFRVDVARPEDLMEEVARLRGYNNIRVTFPVIPAEANRPTETMMARNRVKDRMAAFGFSEVISYSFIGENACDRLRIGDKDPRRRMLGIRNPITEDQGVMRTSLIPGLLETMNRNLAWQNRTLRLFEVGKVFLSNGQESLPEEIEMTGGLWTGLRDEAAWHRKETPCDFYDLKGVVEGLLEQLGVGAVQYTTMSGDDCFYTRPGHTARILSGDTELGLIGEVHPEVLKAFDLKQTAFVFELNLDRLMPMISDEKQAVPLPRFPAVARDISLIVDRNVEAAELIEAVRAAERDLVEDVFLFDVYEGKNMPAGKKSISFRIIYRSHQETLEDDMVTAMHEEIATMLLKRFDATFPT